MDSLFTKVFEWLNSSISAGANIFAQFFTGSWLSLFLSVFAVVTIFRTLIYPLVGVKGSDGVIGEEEKKSRRERSDNK